MMHPGTRKFKKGKHLRKIPITVFGNLLQIAPHLLSDSTGFQEKEHAIARTASSQEGPHGVSEG